MSLVRVGLRLGRRRSVKGVAVFAVLLCALGSIIMQELAHSQRASYNDQVAFAQRVAAQCAGSQACLDRQGAPSTQSLAIYRSQTDALGARARPLQSVGGAVHWAQAWLLTLLGIAALIVVVAMTTAADVEARRLLSGWHPYHFSRRPFVVAGVGGACAAAIVALGAIVGSLAAAVLGRLIWPLGSEPQQVLVSGLGPVAYPDPSAAALVGWAAVVSVVVLLSWFAGRTLVAILLSAGIFGVLALLGDTLPAWWPGSALPATADMWFHHRGEVAHVWIWPLTPLQNGVPSPDWTAFLTSDPGGAALIGAAVVLIAAALAVPWAIRRKLA
jgi:hypothetical protein